ncbi:extracellular solute-binding protein family 1 [Thiorhodococcus drewsii AZ1]|uniref:Extracellular solute-binding protein family 1 n=1 Tax=Thiorhodococcus drewsii AZ1 TaxID=765913 RepID=G2DXV9_9GAMM|nr:extracellular solute-binding protein family 1 [Thiorhodococcus drewsii AZ1]
MVPAAGAPLAVLTRDTSAIGGPAARHAASFQAATGVSIRLSRTSFSELYERIMLGFVTAQMPYDVLLIPSAWLPDFAPYLAPVPDRILEGPVVQDIYPVYRDALMRWRNRVMALTIDGDLHLGAYRRDLFADPEARTAFAAAYGRDLAPPSTWSQYREIAAFFSGRSGSDGQPLAGTLEAYARGGQRIWYLFSHAAAYTNHPDHPGAMFFDPETMTPAIGNPGWVRALTEFLALRHAGPADVASLDSEAVRTRFAAGQASMDIDWADTGVLAGALQGGAASAVAGQVGFFALPGSEEVWNPATRSWDRLPAPRSVTFLAFGGWIGVVPASSTNIDQAWDYLAWLASPEHSTEDVLDGTSGINPYRPSQLADPQPWRKLLGEQQADDYLRVLRMSLTANTIARDLRLPGYRAYIAALEDQLDRVMAGEISPEAGLAAAAEDWESLTDRLGRQAQRRYYRQAMGLENALPSGAPR